MTTPLGSLTFDDGDSVITFQRMFSVTPERLWRAIATEDGLGAWLATGRFDEREGGLVRFEFNEDQTVTGEILVWNPYSELTHTWNINDEIPSTVTYRITETSDGSQLTLTHTRLPAEMASGYTPGWHAYLDRLDQAINGSPVSPWDELFASAMPRYASST